MTAVGPHGNHHVNNAGLRFRTFLEVNSYTALTTYFKKKSYSTWTHPRSKKPHQIDHFLSDKIQFLKGVMQRVISEADDSLPQFWKGVGTTAALAPSRGDRSGGLLAPQ